MLVTYDEGGGFFDHVAPPADAAVDHQPYGTRVPLLAIGPFAKKNYVSHVTMEHSSIVKFIEWNWLGGHDRAARGARRGGEQHRRSARRRQDGHGGAGELILVAPRARPILPLMNASLLLIVGQTTGDRVAIAAALVGILAIAAIILVASSATPRGWRR